MFFAAANLRVWRLGGSLRILVWELSFIDGCGAWGHPVGVVQCNAAPFCR